VFLAAEHRAESGLGAPARQGWLGRTARAIGFARTDGDTILVALAGFLLRGGVVLLVVPSLVLPSVIGVAAATGVDAFGIDGRPTTWLFEIVAVIAAAMAIWLLLAFVIGSVIDAWLIEAALDPDSHAAGRARPLPGLAIVLDLAGIRALCALPLAPAALWAGLKIYTATYNELTAPVNLTTPIVLRVFQGAADGFIVLGIVWLVTEVIAAIAVRRVVIHDHGAWEALGGAFVQIFRRPITTLATVLLSYGVSVVAVVVSIAATATTFDWCRVAVRNQNPMTFRIGVGALAVAPDLRPVIFILAALALGLAWVFALAVLGFASAWRSAAFTEEAAAAAAIDRVSQPPRLGLSGHDPERSGD
jgi:hypothetical protein